MALNLEASLSSLSSELLMKVTQYLIPEDLGRFDSAINNKQLRTKFLVGVSTDTYLFPALNFNECYDILNDLWQQEFAQWLVLRRVFVRSLRFGEETTASERLLFDTINRLNPSLESLTIVGKVDFPMDLAVRNKRTLSELVIREQSEDEMVELKRKGESWKKLTFYDCNFGDLVVDEGADTVTELVIDQCQSRLYDTSGVPSQGCTRLVWDIIHKCPNLQRFSCFDHDDYDSYEEREMTGLVK
jgi:hypothetical protein